MSEVVALFVGAFLGVLVMAFLAAEAYEKGAEDERERFWYAMRPRPTSPPPGPVRPPVPPPTRVVPRRDS